MLGELWEHSLCLYEKTSPGDPKEKENRSGSKGEELGFEKDVRKACGSKRTAENRESK